MFAATDCVDGCGGDEWYNVRFGVGDKYRMFHAGPLVAEAYSTTENLVSWTEFKSFVFRYKDERKELTFDHLS